MNAFDLVVIGAGPAGCAAAIIAARAGQRVLLLEARAWPRGKVCGNCVAPDGVNRLQRLGVSASELPGAEPIVCMRVHAGRKRERNAPCPGVHAGARSVSLPLTPGGVAVARDVLDSALVSVAVGAGVEFRPCWRVGSLETNADRVHVRRADGAFAITADRAVLAGGLGRAIPGTPDALHPRPRRASRMGVGLTIDSDAAGLSRGQIAMHIHRSGYVGMVRLADGRVTIAAAVRPDFVRASGGVGEAVRQIMGPCASSDTWRGMSWTGTPRLTHESRRVFEGRIALAGDACAFVEPFTGEGIAWALASGTAAGLWALGGHRTGCIERELAARRRRCRVTALALRSPALVGAVLALTRLSPGLADRAVRGRTLPARPAFEGVGS